MKLSSLMTRISLILFVLFSAQSAQAQNACGVAAPTGFVSNPVAMFATVSDFGSLDPNGNPIVASFSIEVSLAGKVIDTQSISKSTAQVQTGTPANCYRFPFPTISNTQPNTGYAVSIRSIGPGGQSALVASSNGFFLPGAPTAPGSFRLGLLDTLLNLFHKVTSTHASKSWFEPIGR